MPKRSSKVEVMLGVLRDILTEEEMRQLAGMVLGQAGGKKGGRSRAQKLTKARRSEIARKAANARWSRQNEE